jgi:hypothetical protein
MKTTPRILSKSIINYLVPPDDGFDEQEHERDTSGNGTQVKEGSPDYEARKEAFNKKFSAGVKAPPELGGAITPEQIEQARLAAERKGKTAEEQKLEAQEVAKGAAEKKGPGSNIPKIIDDKRAAEKERDELRAKLQEFETKVKPELDNKISELQKKIDSGDYTPAKEQEFQSKIEKLEAERDKKEQALVTENQSLKNTIAFYDIQQSEEFQKEYLDPVFQAHTEMVSAINGNPKAEKLLQQALQCNGMAIDAKNEADRRAAIQERGVALAAAIEEINDPILSEQLKSGFRDYIKAADAHKKALRNHVEPKAQAIKMAEQKKQEAYAQQIQVWKGTFESEKGLYAKDEELSPEDKKIALDIGIKLDSDIEKSESTALKVVLGKTDMSDAISMVHKGRVYPVLKAKIAIRDRRIADLEAVVAKLRGGGTGGGETTTPPARRESEDGKPTNREEFHKKFRPGRA